jgi:hypothetical protein
VGSWQQPWDTRQIEVIFNESKKRQPKKIAAQDLQRDREFGVELPQQQFATSAETAVRRTFKNLSGLHGILENLSQNRSACSFRRRRRYAGGRAAKHLEFSSESRSNPEARLNTPLPAFRRRHPTGP